MKTAEVEFPLIQLLRKFKDVDWYQPIHPSPLFPLIQLLRKFKAGRTAFAVRGLHLVSINSTSSEVQSASF